MVVEVIIAFICIFNNSLYVITYPLLLFCLIVSFKINSICVVYTGWLSVFTVSRWALLQWRPLQWGLYIPQSRRCLQRILWGTWSICWFLRWVVHEVRPYKPGVSNIRIRPTRGSSSARRMTFAKCENYRKTKIKKYLKIGFIIQKPSPI